MMFALITGGVQGLGRRFALTLLQRGGNVVVADVDQNLGVKFESEIFKQYGDKRLKFIKCDVSDTKELHGAFDYCFEEFGQLDIVCNNAGIMTSDINLSSKQVAINLTAVIESTFKGIDLMSMKNGGNGGVVVNISSGSGYNVLRGAPVYTATKFGVIGFSRSFKFLPNILEDGVRVNCLCPLFLETEMTRKATMENPEVEYQINRVGYSDIDDVTDAFMMCIEDESLNGDVLAMHIPRHIYQLKFKQPIPVPLKK